MFDTFKLMENSTNGFLYTRELSGHFSSEDNNTKETMAEKS